MGLSTIVSMLCYVAVPKWGHPMLLFTEVLFWITTALSFLVCFVVLSLMYVPLPLPHPLPISPGVSVTKNRLTRQPHTFPSFTGVLILPTVTLVVLDGRLFFEKGFHESSSRRVLDLSQRKRRGNSLGMEDPKDCEMAKGIEESCHEAGRNGLGMGKG